MEIPEKIKTSNDAPVDKNSAAKINVFVLMSHFPPVGDEHYILCYLNMVHKECQHCQKFQKNRYIDFSGKYQHWSTLCGHSSAFNRPRQSGSAQTD
jgi:hypothetical protein